MGFGVSGPSGIVAQEKDRSSNVRDPGPAVLGLIRSFLGAPLGRPHVLAVVEEQAFEEVLIGVGHPFPSKVPAD